MAEANTSEVVVAIVFGVLQLIVALIALWQQHYLHSANSEPSIAVPHRSIWALTTQKSNQEDKTLSKYLRNTAEDLGHWSLVTRKIIQLKFDKWIGELLERTRDTVVYTPRCLFDYRSTSSSA